MGGTAALSILKGYVRGDCLVSLVLMHALLCYMWCGKEISIHRLSWSSGGSPHRDLIADAARGALQGISPHSISSAHLSSSLAPIAGH